MLILILLTFAALFILFLFYLLKTAPYGCEKDEGFRFFKTIKELEDFIKHEEEINKQTELKDAANL